MLERLWPASGQALLLAAGVLSTCPLAAWAKGQWCNQPSADGERAALTLQSATVDGADVTPAAAPVGLELKTEFQGEPDTLHAAVYDADAPDQLRKLHLRPAPP